LHHHKQLPSQNGHDHNETLQQFARNAPNLSSTSAADHGSTKCPHSAQLELVASNATTTATTSATFTSSATPTTFQIGSDTVEHSTNSDDATTSAATSKHAFANERHVESSHSVAEHCNGRHLGPMFTATSVAGTLTIDGLQSSTGQSGNAKLANDATLSLVGATVDASVALVQRRRCRSLSHGEQLGQQYQHTVADQRLQSAGFTHFADRARSTVTSDRCRQQFDYSNVG
jgi:hypothetical protein